ncbi:MAG TPA: PrsW family intramembrane metalloprotease, partial [Mycobacterium sp.]|nr:PrsW family intramembrane metalloprotease [Mycobacterium sp.]
AEPRRIGRGLLLMVAAMLLHGAWDTMTAFAGLSPLAMLGFIVAVIVTALVIAARVYSVTVTRERGFLRDVMAPEEARKVITASELEAMTGDHKARRAYRRAGRTRGGRKRARYVLNAGYDLAGALATARGAETDPVWFARAEVGRVRAGLPSPV